MRIVFAVSLLVSLACDGLSAFAADEPFVPANVTMRRTGAGVFFTDAKGMALYTYAQDNKPGKSACIDSCARTWPPLTAGADASNAKGDWSVITRDDGTPQWAFRGKPLYTYIRDSYQGGAFGDRLGNAWNVATDPIILPPGLAIRALYVGRTLTDKRGMTLYTREDETKGKSACEKLCLETWVPLAAPQLANPIGEWTVLARSDGTQQWAYQGRRLYLNATDIKPGDLRGAGVDKVWRAAILEPAAALPSWVTVQRSDMGEIFADAKGLTLYTFSGALDKTRQITCGDDCLKANWRTVPAEADAKPFGDWTAIASEGGAKTWAYKGNIVYTHTRDTEPGAVGGDKWAAGVGGGGGGFIPIPRRRDFEE